MFNQQDKSTSWSLHKNVEIGASVDNLCRLTSWRQWFENCRLKKYLHAGCFREGILCCIILYYWLIEYLIICTSLIHSLSASPLSYSGFLPVFCYLCRKRQEIEANVHILNIKIKRCFHNHAKCSSLEK